MVWIFGYGSLVWKSGFPYVRKVPGYVKGFKRRFWWWSEDHRGVPGAPGRVVNLLPDNQDNEVWGLAYEIDDQVWEDSVREQLDYREKGGYTKHKAIFYPRDLEIGEQEVSMYLGTTDHRQFAGPDTLDKMAATILACTGPSGRNRDYLYGLADAMKEIAPEQKDDHLYDLDKAVREGEREEQNQALSAKA